MNRPPSSLNMLLSRHTRRREFITLVGGAALAGPVTARAQQPGRTYHLGLVMPFPREVFSASHFFDELERRGFIERQNLTIDYRDFSPNVDLIPEYAAALVKAQSDVIYAGGGVAVRAVQQATKTLNPADPEALEALDRAAVAPCMP